MKDKFKNPNHMVHMTWSEKQEEDNYGRDYEDALPTFTDNIKTKSITLEKLEDIDFCPRGGTWYGNELHTDFDTSLFKRKLTHDGVVKINLGESKRFTKKDDYEYYDYMQRKDENAGREDLLRSLSITGVEYDYSFSSKTHRAKRGDAKPTNIVTVEFSIPQSIALNYLFRAMESRIEKMQQHLTQYYIKDKAIEAKEEAKKKEEERLKEEEHKKRIEEFDKKWAERGLT